MKWSCPKCGRDNTMIVNHGKWVVELFCFSCGEFYKDSKNNKLKLEHADPGVFDGEEWSI